MNYLTKEEQYKDILNDQEILRIESRELREIRYKYWKKIMDIFRDERHISDSEFIKLSDELREQEKKEIMEYRKKINDLP